MIILFLRSASVRSANNVAKPSEAGICKPRDANNLSKLTNSSLTTNLQLKELQSGVNRQTDQTDINCVKPHATLNFTHLDTRRKIKYTSRWLTLHSMTFPASKAHAGLSIHGRVTNLSLVSYSSTNFLARLALNFKGLDYKTVWVEYPDIKPTFSPELVCPYLPPPG
jgi:hypothetical protein